MTKRLLALLLALALLAAFFTGCAKTESAPQSAEEAPASQQEAAPETTPAEQAAPETEEAPAEPAPEAETPAPADEPAPEEAPAFSISYPLESGQVITGWFAWFGGLNTMTGFFADTDYDLLYVIPLIEEGCGVDLDLITVSDTIASEQFKLMIASGDWPDYCGSFGQMYSGGLLQAYEDECIQSFDDEYLMEYAPDYWAVRGQLTGDDLASALENHMNLGIYTISDEIVEDQGFLTRADWYAEQGNPDVSRLEGFTDYLYDCFNAYRGDSMLHMEEGGSPGYIDDAFGVSIPSYSGTSVPYYVDDGVVKSALVADEYYEYLQWFRQLYADGIINNDFYSRSMMTYQRFNYIANGQIAVWPCNPGSVHDQNRYLTEGQQEIGTVPMSVVTDDGVNDWATKRTVIGGCYTVASDCEYTEDVLAFMNYMYTHEGSMLGNWGEEGLTYDLDENGEPYYTDLIVNNEFNTMPENMVRGYMDEVFPVYRDADRLWCTYDEEMLAAATCWGSVESTYDHAYPTAAGLTTDEQSSITNDSADIMTFVSTEILGFMTGNTDLNEETWSSFCAQLDSMGLQRVLDVYQNAYDEAMAGER